MPRRTCVFDDNSPNPLGSEGLKPWIHSKVIFSWNCILSTLGPFGRGRRHCWYRSRKARDDCHSRTKLFSHILRGVGHSPAGRAHRNNPTETSIFSPFLYLRFAMPLHYFPFIRVHFSTGFRPNVSPCC